MKKHFLKCCGISDACPKPDSQGSASDGCQLGSKPLKSHHSGESESKSKKHKGDKTHGSKESKTEGKVASQDELLESLHWSSCLARASMAGGSQEDVGKVPHTHQSHKKLKKHGKSLHKKSHHWCQMQDFQFLLISQFVLSIKYTVHH